MNEVHLIGNLTKEPDIKYTQSGVAVVSFILAVDRDYKNADGTTPTDYISCVAWRKQAEYIANWIKKGYMVAVSGSLQVRSYQPQPNETRLITEVMVEKVKNLTPKQPNQSAPKQEPKPQSNNNDEYNGLPF